MGRCVLPDLLVSQNRIALLQFAATVALCLLSCACRNESNSLEFVEQSPPQVANVTPESPSITDRPNRAAKQAFLKTSPLAPPVEAVSESLMIPVHMVRKGPAIRREPPLLPLRQTRTKLVPFRSAPFPYDGIVPSTGRRFLDVNDNGRLGHRTSNGTVYWEDATYNDSRTLLHIPRGFDARRPALMIVFLHGHGAKLQRDVIDRQRVPEQVSEAGVNAVLVAPQLASDAADSSAGRLWERGGFARFLEEAAAQLAKIHGDPRSLPVFEKMPVVIVAYSGGYATAASCIRNGEAGKRVRGIVLLDALYGDMDTFATWISTRQKAFFLSAFANSTRARNAELKELLKERDVTFNTELKGRLRGGSVTFVSTAPDTEHRDFVTSAWAHHPIKDLLQRLRAEAR